MIVRRAGGPPFVFSFTYPKTGCPILDAVSSRQGWESTKASQSSFFVLQTGSVVNTTQSTEPKALRVPFESYIAYSVITKRTNNHSAGSHSSRRGFHPRIRLAFAFAAPLNFVA
jgi:hypothetical protein